MCRDAFVHVSRWFPHVSRCICPCVEMVSSCVEMKKLRIFKYLNFKNSPAKCRAFDPALAGLTGARGVSQNGPRVRAYAAYAGTPLMIGQMARVRAQGCHLKEKNSRHHHVPEGQRTTLRRRTRDTIISQRDSAAP